jgi:hypothetical protein
VKGDSSPIDYEIRDGRGIARVTLREGQARRVRAGDLPPLDRPLHFAVRRGNHPPILAETLDDLRDALDRQPRKSRDDRPERGGPPPKGGRKGGGQRQRHQGRRRR